MKAPCSTSTTLLQFPSQLPQERPRSNSSSVLSPLHKRSYEQCGFEASKIGANLRGLKVKNRSSTVRSCVKLSQVSKDIGSSAYTIKSRHLCASCDSDYVLKKKAWGVSPFLNGRCIFLVGMMGSGKTTVGRVLAEALGYCFVDSDQYIELAMGGGTTVKQIFEEFGESLFREHETEALKELAVTPQLVVATGGGAVMQPVNWEYMKQGITVHLDVPLDALAKRIAAVGTHSRPLLDFEAGDAYTKAFMGLFTLSKKRAEAYANAHTRVSLQQIADELGLDDVGDITPSAIAVEVLNQLDKFLDCNKIQAPRELP